MDKLTEDDIGAELWVAAQEGRAGDVPALLARLRPCAWCSPKCIMKAAEIAAFNDHAAAVHAIVELRPDTLEEAMKSAARGGSLQAIEVLLPFTASARYRSIILGMSLCAAGCEGHADAARLLLLARADVNYRGCNILEAVTAYSWCCLDVVKVLLSAKAEVNSRGTHWNSLHRAADGRRADVVQVLADAKADVDVCAGQEGLPPLGTAMLRGALDVMQVLVDAKADVDRRCSRRGITPLVYAMSHAPAACKALRLLVSAKADVNKATADGETPAVFARKWSTHEALRILMCAKADVGARGFYPL
jgi:ankyrin repeat protein